MTYLLAVFSSVHQVNRMKNVLNKDGRYFGMIRAPHAVFPGGCGFALRFEERAPVGRAGGAGIRIAINGIFKEGKEENGSKVYVRIQ